MRYLLGTRAPTKLVDNISQMVITANFILCQIQMHIIYVAQVTAVDNVSLLVDL